MKTIITIDRPEYDPSDELLMNRPEDATHWGCDNDQYLERWYKVNPMTLPESEDDEISGDNISFVTFDPCKKEWMETLRQLHMDTALVPEDVSESLVADTFSIIPIPIPISSNS